MLYAKYTKNLNIQTIYCKIYIKLYQNKYNSNKLKTKNWNHIIIPISDIISNGMNINNLSGIMVNGGSSGSEATVIYINDMYFK